MQTEYKPKSKADEEGNWIEAPKIPLDAKTKNYKQRIEGLEPEEEYDTAHLIIDDTTGDVLDDVLLSPASKKVPKYGEPNQNTVEVKKVDDKLEMKWNLDNLPDDETPKSYIVSSAKLCLDNRLDNHS